MSPACEEVRVTEASELIDLDGSALGLEFCRQPRQRRMLSDRDDYVVLPLSAPTEASRSTPMMGEALMAPAEATAFMQFASPLRSLPLPSTAVLRARAVPVRNRHLIEMSCRFFRKRRGNFFEELHYTTLDDHGEHSAAPCRRGLRGEQYRWRCFRPADYGERGTRALLLCRPMPSIGEGKAVR